MSEIPSGRKLLQACLFEPNLSNLVDCSYFPKFKAVPLLPSYLDVSVPNF